MLQSLTNLVKEMENSSEGDRLWFYLGFRKGQLPARK